MATSALLRGAIWAGIKRVIRGQAITANLVQNKEPLPYHGCSMIKSRPGSRQHQTPERAVKEPILGSARSPKEPFLAPTSQLQSLADGINYGLSIWDNHSEASTRTAVAYFCMREKDVTTEYKKRHAHCLLYLTRLFQQSDSFVVSLNQLCWIRHSADFYCLAAKQSARLNGLKSLQFPNSGFLFTIFAALTSKSPRMLIPHPGLTPIERMCPVQSSRNERLLPNQAPSSQQTGQSRSRTSRRRRTFILLNLIITVFTEYPFTRLGPSTPTKDSPFLDVSRSFAIELPSQFDYVVSHRKYLFLRNRHGPGLRVCRTLPRTDSGIQSGRRACKHGDWDIGCQSGRKRPSIVQFPYGTRSC
jgi:hypothetical protein